MTYQIHRPTPFDRPPYQLPYQPQFMEAAIALAQQGMEAGKGGPFGAVVVKNSQIIGQGHNEVTSSHDPTAHAEVLAIRRACQQLQTFQLTGCELYTSCEPCPMCLGAIYWSRLDRVYYANSQQDAAAIGFDDQFIYQQLEQVGADRQIPFIHVPDSGAIEVFQAWMRLENKLEY